MIKDRVPSGPDQIWVSDIICVAAAEGCLYLAVILDLFSRRVIGWKLVDHYCYLPLFAKLRDCKRDASGAPLMHSRKLLSVREIFVNTG